MGRNYKGQKWILILGLLCRLSVAGNEAGANGSQIPVWFTLACNEVVDAFKRAEVSGTPLLSKSNLSAKALEQGLTRLIVRVIKSDDYFLDVDGNVRDLRVTFPDRDSPVKPLYLFPTVYLRESVWLPLFQRNTPDYGWAFYALLKLAFDSESEALAGTGFSTYESYARQLPAKAVARGLFSNRIPLLKGNSLHPYGPTDGWWHDRSLDSEREQKLAPKLMIEKWFHKLAKEVVVQWPRASQLSPTLKSQSYNRLASALQSKILFYGLGRSPEDIDIDRDHVDGPLRDLLTGHEANYWTKNRATAQFSREGSTIYLDFQHWNALFLNRTPDYALVLHALLLAAGITDAKFTVSTKFPLSLVVRSPYEDVADTRRPQKALPIGRTGPEEKAIANWFRQVGTRIISKVEANPGMIAPKGEFRNWHGAVMPFPELDILKLRHELRDVQVILVDENEHDSLLNPWGQIADVRFVYYLDHGIYAPRTLLLKLSTWRDLYRRNAPDYQLAFHALLLAADYDDSRYAYSSQLKWR